MNEDQIAILKTILAKEPRELRADEIAFLHARWAYIGKNSRARFQDTVFGKGKKAEEQGKPQKSVEEVAETKDETVEPDAVTPENPFETIDEDETEE